MCIIYNSKYICDLQKVRCLSDHTVMDILGDMAIFSFSCKDN
jgi:hypothetical protein